ncbi:MAG: hypothetical protein PUD16_08905 [bacterium]|nr:hypothetical protein [bacterium]
MKRIVSLVLAAMMLLGMMSFASADEPVKLTALFIAHPLTKHVDEMKWVSELEERAGVDVTWEVIWTDWDTVKSQRFASGDIPDLLFNATIDADYTTYEGLFADLTKYVDAMPNVTAMFTEEPDTLALAKTLEGKIYGLPKFQGKWPDTNTVMFVNKVWLENVGKEVPTTLSELKDVLMAFKENDANGNGNPNDEIPMDFNGWFGGAYGLHNLIGSWGIQQTNWGYYSYFAEGGQVKAFAVDERYKEMMIYLADLYANGLINENAITNDYSMFQSLSRGDAEGNALVGVVMGWEETDKFGPTLHSQYVPCGPFQNDLDPKYADVAPRWPYDFSGLNMSGNRVCMSAKCENPEAAMKFVDLFYGEAESVEGLFGGIIDGNVAKVGDNHYEVLPPPAEANTDPGTWKWTSTFADNAPMYIRRATRVDMTIDMEYALTEREQYKESIALVDMENEYYPQMLMKYTAEDQNTMAVAQANVDNIIDNYWGLWLTGESDVEEDWEDYVDAAMAAGLNDILQIRQAAYDVFKAQ